MRFTVRSESAAFRLTVVAALLIGCSLVAGWLTTPLVGAVVFALIGLVLLIVHLRKPDPDRGYGLREAVRDPHPHGAPSGVRHVLVVANEALAGDELSRKIATGGTRVEVDILAPVLTSHAHFATSDIDREVASAQARLDRSLAWAHEHGFVARGEIGDPNPLTAIEDELRDFGADEVIVVTHPRTRATWQERRELKRLRGELDMPVTHVAGTS